MSTNTNREPAVKSPAPAPASAVRFGQNPPPRLDAKTGRPIDLEISGRFRIISNNPALPSLAGVRFTKGVGFTSEPVKADWFKLHGFKVEEIPPRTQQQDGPAASREAK